MPLHKLQESELREHCKRIIENLERWLRDLIDKQFTDAHGSDYINAVDAHGKDLIDKGIKRDLERKIRQKPRLYPRSIDAADLKHEIDLLCDPRFYEKYFEEALREAFPDGEAEAKTFLERLRTPRNPMSHANPISVREAERIICYSNDVIDSLKNYYRKMNLQQKFPVPTTLRITDSLGTTVHARQIPRNRNGNGQVDRRSDEACELHAGEVLSLEVVVDPSFDPDSYDISWNYQPLDGPRPSGPKVVIPLQDKHVINNFVVWCFVTAKNQDWHKMGSYDDLVTITYEVLPRI